MRMHLIWRIGSVNIKNSGKWTHVAFYCYGLEILCAANEIEFKVIRFFSRLVFYSPFFKCFDNFIFFDFFLHRKEFFVAFHKFLIE